MSRAHEILGALTGMVAGLADSAHRVKGQIARRSGESAKLPAELGYGRPDQEYVYTVYWVKTVREWDQAHRRSIMEAVNPLLTRPDFEANPTERRYCVAGLEGRYSGLSLKALAKVLESWLEESEA